MSLGLSLVDTRGYNSKSIAFRLTLASINCGAYMRQTYKRPIFLQSSRHMLKEDVMFLVPYIYLR